MTRDFKSFSTVFQSYKDDGRMLIKDCALESRLRLRSFRPRAGLELGSA